jgi:hypothetical protein
VGLPGRRRQLSAARTCSGTGVGVLVAVRAEPVHHVPEPEILGPDVDPDLLRRFADDAVEDRLAGLETAGIKPEKMSGPVHNYRIDWDPAVTG